MYKKVSSIVIFVLLCFYVTAQLTKGDRMLAWQVDMAENGNYDSAFAYAKTGCVESVHLFFTWADMEPDTNNFDPSLISYLDIANLYYPYKGVKAELQIAPVNTNVLEVPSELGNLAFNHPLMIRRFKQMLDTVFKHIPDLELAALNIGNESDVYFGSEPLQYNLYSAFLDSVIPYAQQLYHDLHDTALNVGTTFTFHGLTSESTAPLCQYVNKNRDILPLTYYPLDTDFTMLSPDAVFDDFDTLTTLYKDTNQPIYFVECGYSTSAYCESSEMQQAQFYANVFSAWDKHASRIKYLTIFKSTDWSQEQVDTMAVYYGLYDTVFLEYLRTLGVRTWPGNGQNKLAYNQILCELNARNWCNVSCPYTGFKKKTGGTNNVALFPNPVENYFTIVCPNHNSACEFELLDIKGKVVFRKQINKARQTFTNPGLKGMYFYRIKAAGKHLKVGKIVF